MSFKRRESHKILQKSFYIGHWFTVIAIFSSNGHILTYSEIDNKNAPFTSMTAKSIILAVIVFNTNPL